VECVELTWTHNKDSLSLSLFEALRGLRDAVAPETSPQIGAADGVEGGASSSQQQQQVDQSHKSKSLSAIDHEDMDYDDFLMAYHKDDPYALELIKASDGKPPRTREEYFKLRAMNEMKKHSELVPKLAQGILSASDALDNLVSELPGMHRTKQEQMKRIEELLVQNEAADEQLQISYQKATERRNEIRQVLQHVTCQALGIQEEE